MDELQQKTAYALRLTVRQVIGGVGAIAFLATISAMLLIFVPKDPFFYRGRFVSPEKVALLAWGGLTLSSVLLPYVLAVSWKALFFSQKIEFAMDGIWLPKSYWSSQHVLVPFSDIREVRLHAYAGGRDMTIEMPFRRFMIRESWLPTPAAFDDIYAGLNEGIAAAKQAEPGVGADSR